MRQKAGTCTILKLPSKRTKFLCFLICIVRPVTDLRLKFDVVPLGSGVKILFLTLWVCMYPILVLRSWGLSLCTKKLGIEIFCFTTFGKAR